KLDASLGESECGQANIIALAISGGQASYTLKWDGPQSGSQITNAQEYQIPDLPPGDYKLEVTDAKGCTAQASIEIKPSQVDLLSLSTEPGLCGRYGAIIVQIPGGKPTYTVTWTGPQS